jgi:hypothetical protein
VFSFFGGSDRVCFLGVSFLFCLFYSVLGGFERDRGKDVLCLGVFLFFSSGGEGGHGSCDVPVSCTGIQPALLSSRSFYTFPLTTHSPFHSQSYRCPLKGINVGRPLAHPVVLASFLCFSLKRYSQEIHTHSYQCSHSLYVRYSYCAHNLSANPPSNQTKTLSHPP